jgi:probable F420-dependent oxidoreductase
MKFGLGLPLLNLYKLNAGPWEPASGVEPLLHIARRADELGYDWLSFTDHVFMPEEWVEVFGPRWTDPLTAMAFIGGATRRIGLLSNVMILPYRNPLVTAKVVATADFLTQGRILLGLGAGHMQREFEILQVPFAERGVRTDEYLRIMIELWTQENPRFEGQFFQFERIKFEPKPVQKPYPPIWIGGNAKVAIRRAVRLGDGWLPWLVKVEELPDYLTYLRAQPEYQRRERPFDVVARLDRVTVANPGAHTHRPTDHWLPTGRDETLKAVERLKEAGATGTNVPLGRTDSPEQFLERIEWFAANIMSEYKD